MRYIDLKISEEEKSTKEKRERAVVIRAEIPKARAAGNEAEVVKLQNELNALNVNPGSICGDAEVLKMMIDLFEVNSRADNRISGRIFALVENFEAGFLALTDEDHTWLMEKASKIPLAEKFKDQLGNPQDKYPGPLKRAIDKVQTAIELAVSVDPREAK